MNLKSASATVSALALMATSSQAALVSISFSTGFTPEVLDSNLAANSLTAGTSQLDASNIDNTFQDGEALEGPAAPALALKYSSAGARLTQPRADLADSIGANRYLAYTLDGSGADIDLTSLTLDLGKSSSGANINVDVLVDQDNNGFDVGDAVDTTGVAAGTNLVAPLSWDLSSVATSSNPIEVRIYVHTTASTGSHDYSIDNIVINGIVVPEPGSLALLGLGGLLIARRRRG